MVETLDKRGFCLGRFDDVRRVVGRNIGGGRKDGNFRLIIVVVVVAIELRNSGGHGDSTWDSVQAKRSAGYGGVVAGTLHIMRTRCVRTCRSPARDSNAGRK